MMRKVVTRSVLVGALLFTMLVAPRRAAATDNLEYIIPAAVTGVVAVVIIVAILMADRTDPDMELTAGMPPLGPPKEGIKLAPSCPMTAAGRPLLCW